LRVGCLGFGFHKTARVNVNVEPVSERVLMLKLNAPSPSSTPHVRLSYDSSLHPRKIPWITQRGYAQYDIDLPSESEGQACACILAVINFRRAKPLVHRPLTFPHQAERVRIRGHQRELQFQDQARWFMYDHSGNGCYWFEIWRGAARVLSVGVWISAGVFPPPVPTCFSDSQKHFTIAFSKTA